jgi:iron complex transport system substrate-binding protein
MVEIAGGREVLARAGKPSRPVTWKEIAKAAPEVVVIMACGLPLERSLREAKALSKRPEWASLAAVRAGEVYAAEGPSYFNGGGPRLVDGVEILAEILHPGRFEFGHRGLGWEPLDG